MGSVVIVVLAVAWASVLVPAVLRNYAQRTPSNSARSLRGAGSRRSSLGSGSLSARSRSAYAVNSGPSRRSVKRRRDVFLGLLALAGGSAVLAMVPGLQALWALQFAADFALVAYVGLLLRVKSRGASARAAYGRPARYDATEYAWASQRSGE